MVSRNLQDLERNRRWRIEEEITSRNDYVIRDDLTKITPKIYLFKSIYSLILLYIRRANKSFLLVQDFITWLFRIAIIHSSDSSSSKFKSLARKRLSWSFSRVLSLEIVAQEALFRRTEIAMADKRNLFARVVINPLLYDPIARAIKQECRTFQVAHNFFVDEAKSLFEISIK